MQKSYRKQDLQSFSGNISFWKRRMGFMTINRVESFIWIERIILFLEYSQLMSQIILVCCDSYVSKTGESDVYLDKRYLFDIITYLFKLINPSFLISFNESNSTTASILCLVFAFSMLKLVLFGYIVFVSWSKKSAGNPILVDLWRWVYKLQGRVFCFFVTSFWARSLLGLENEGFRLFGVGRPGCIMIFSLLITIENMFSIYLETQFCYRLPSKRFLASKGFQMQLATLTQKMILQIIQLSFKTSSLACLWVFTSLNVVFCLVRSQMFYTTLPLYKIQALLYQSDLVSIVNSLSFACFFQTLLKATRYSEIDSNFPIIFAIALSILSAKASRGYLCKLIQLLLLTNSAKNRFPDFLIHKVKLTKHLEKKLEMPGKKNTKFDWILLMTKTKNHIREKEEERGILNHHHHQNEIFLDFLEGLSQKFPKNSLIKLHIAKICSKKPELYARAIKISADVAKNFWSQNYITISFLLKKIEKSIAQAFTTSEAKLDLYTYIKSQVFLEELKDEVSQQTRLTINLCKNILQDVTDIGVIFDQAQEIHQYRMRIEKKMDNFSRKIPEHFVTPVRLWAEYQLVLNFSLHDYHKYNGIYSNKYSKYEKYFKTQNLTQENLYQETNALLLLSGQKIDNGQILFCNKPMEDLCGTKLDSIYGSHFSSLLTSSLQAPFADIFRQLFENGKMSILNQTTRAFLKHRNGFIIEVDFYLRIHPYITENLYLNMLIRPVPSENEYLLLRENGDIEGATRNLWRKLNLDSSKTASSAPITINIKALSTELSRVNEAFNIVRRQQLISKTVVDSPKLNIENFSVKRRNFSDAINKSGYFITKNRALEMHSQYSSEPQKVKVWPLKTNLKITQESLYDCQISVLNYGSVSMKLLRLQEISDQENNDSSPERRKSLHASPRVFNFQPQQVAKNSSFSSMGDGEVENIDCEEIKHTDRIITEWKNTLLTTTEGNLVSPRTNRSHAYLLSPRVEEKPMTLLNLPASNSDPVTPRKLKIKKMKSQHSGNPLSQALTETKFHKTFRKAISVKSYPRVLKALFWVVYTILLVSFGSLIAIKIYSDVIYNDLSIKKDMLVYAQLRTFYVIRTQTTCRGAGLQIVGALVADYEAYLKIGELIEVSHAWIDELTDANQGIIQKMDYLESDIQTKLFQRDVAIIGTYLNSSDSTSTKMTSFQAIDEIQTSLQRLYNLPSSDYFSSSAYHLFSFIALNTLNDIVAKNLEITNLFIESVERERDLLHLIMVLEITFLPILMVILVSILVYTIWRQYNVEKNHMLAFVKLHPQGVKILLNNLTKFQRRLAGEERFEEKEDILNLLGDSRISIYHKKQSNQTIQYSRIQKKYWSYIVRVLFYVTILLGIIIWNYVSAARSASTIYKRQDQLQFANQASVIISLSYISYTELFASNNTNYVNRQLPYDSLIGTMDKLNDVQDQLKSVFLEDDSTYDPEIQALIFNSTCSDLWSLFSNYCEYLEVRGQNTGLNYALSLFRMTMRDQPGNYVKANKTTLNQIVAAGLGSFDLLLWSSGTAAAEAILVSQIVDAKLEKDISNGKSERTIILVVFVIILAIVGLLMWKQILGRISNVNNSFKKVLQVFPADFVLSSFLLKNFLMESSQAIQNF